MKNLILIILTAFTAAAQTPREFVRSFDTANALQSSTIDAQHKSIYLRGWSSAGDGMGGLFRYNTTSTATTNATDVLAQTYGAAQGRYIRVSYSGAPHPVSLSELGTLDFVYAPNAVYVTDTGQEGMFQQVLTANLPSWAASDVTGMAVAEPGGTGKWVRQWEGRASIKWFGATGDGTTDDAVALKEAIDTGLTLSAPSGTYLLGQVVTTNVNFDIQGPADRSATFLAKTNTVTKTSQTVSSLTIHVDELATDTNGRGVVQFDWPTPDASKPTWRTAVWVTWPTATLNSGVFYDVMPNDTDSMGWAYDDMAKATGQVNGSIDIQSLSHTGSTVTVVTTSAHGLSAGNNVTLSNLLGEYDGTYTIATVPNSTTLTFTKSFPSITLDYYPETGGWFYFDSPIAIAFDHITFDGQGNDAAFDGMFRFTWVTWPTGGYWDGFEKLSVTDCKLMDSPQGDQIIYLYGSLGPTGVDPVLDAELSRNTVSGSYCLANINSYANKVLITDNKVDCSGSWGADQYVVEGAGDLFYVKGNQNVFGDVTISGNLVHHCGMVWGGGWGLRSLNLSGNTFFELGNPGDDTALRQFTQAANVSTLSVGKWDDNDCSVVYADNSISFMSDYMTAGHYPYAISFEASAIGSSDIYVDNCYFYGANIRDYGLGGMETRLHVKNTTFVEGGTITTTEADDTFVDCRFDNTYLRGGLFSGCTFIDGRVDVTQSTTVANNIFYQSSDGNVIDCSSMQATAKLLVTGNRKMAGSAKAYIRGFAVTPAARNITIVDDGLDSKFDYRSSHVSGASGRPSMDRYALLSANTYNFYASAAWKANTVEVTEVNVIGTPNAGDTITVDGVTFTWAAAPATSTEILIGSTTGDNERNLGYAIRSYFAGQVWASGDGYICSIEAPINGTLNVTATGSWYAITVYSDEYNGPISRFVTDGSGLSVSKIYGYSGTSARWILDGADLVIKLAAGDKIVPTASPANSVDGIFNIKAPIVGPATLRFTHNGYSWDLVGRDDRPLLLSAALSGAAWLTPGTDRAVQVVTSATATPVFKLSATNAVQGAQWRVVNQDASNSLDVNDSDGTTLLKTIPASGWAAFQWDADNTTYVLISAGSL